MFNRKKLKELLDIEAKKAGSVRAAASHLKINSTSIQDYIDEITEPRGKNLEKIADYFRVPVAQFYNNTADIPTARFQITPHDPHIEINDPFKDKYIACMEELLKTKEELLRVKEDLDEMKKPWSGEERRAAHLPPGRDVK